MMSRFRLATLMVLLLVLSAWNWLTVFLVSVVSVRTEWPTSKFLWSVSFSVTKRELNVAHHETPSAPTTYQPTTRQTPVTQQVPAIQRTPATQRQRVDLLGTEIVRLARNMTANGKGPLLLTIINKRYLPLTFNWLCHTREIEGVQENLMFMVQGKDTERQLKKRWPDVKTITVNTSADELGQPLVFGTVGYIRMMVRRTELLNSLVQSNISFVLFETDFIWFENPVPDLIRMANEKDLDIVGTVSTAPMQLMCGALIYFRSTTRMRTLWGEVTRQMHELARRVQSKDDKTRAPFRENEQVYLNRLLETNYTDARYGLLPYETVVDGKWYHMKVSQKSGMQPKAIHNNFLDTTKKKEVRFKKFYQWVLKRNMSCDRVQVEKLTQPSKTRREK